MVEQTDGVKGAGVHVDLPLGVNLHSSGPGVRSSGKDLWSVTYCFPISVAMLTWGNGLMAVTWVSIEVFWRV